MANHLCTKCGLNFNNAGGVCPRCSYYGLPTPAAADLADVEARWFPIMVGRSDKPSPLRCPWSVAEKAYSAYAAQYGSKQSLERLAERGGFYAGEMDDLYPKWREETEEIPHLLAKLRAAREEIDIAVRRVAATEHDASIWADKFRYAQQDKEAAESRASSLAQENERLRAAMTAKLAADEAAALSDAGAHIRWLRVQDEAERAEGWVDDADRFKAAADMLESLTARLAAAEAALRRLHDLTLTAATDSTIRAAINSEFRKLTPAAGGTEE